MSSVRLWEHQRGDEYLAVLVHAWMNETGYGFNYEAAGLRTASHSNAKRDGFAASESDDFNIWVFRNGQFAAVLWMNEVVDDDPKTLAKLAAESGGLA